LDTIATKPNYSTKLYLQLADLRVVKSKRSTGQI
jgi:hypothetical protein